MLFQSLVLLGSATLSLAGSVPNRIARQQPSTTASAPAQSTICGDIIDAVNQGKARWHPVLKCRRGVALSLLHYAPSPLALRNRPSPRLLTLTDIFEDYQVFAASDAYECLTSVPFNSAVASRFIAYWNETIQFQSTLAYLKDPPEGYQQPAFDVVAELARIQQRVDADAYKNQYDFEADFQLLTYAFKDGHVTLTAGVLSAFSFGSPYEIASVSVDGKQAPRIYLTDDIIDSRSGGYVPSPVTTINGTEVNEFLTSYATYNSWGYVEAHAEWNDLMSHPNLDIQGGLTTFSGSGTFYPGDNLTFTFENGTSHKTIWVAIYNDYPNATGPLTTGGDFYNYFVLGLLPASFDYQDPTDATNTTEDITGTALDTSEGAPGNWSKASYGAFPEAPDVVQADLGVLNSGLVTGYFYDDISTGVLSLPSFDAIPVTIGNYSDTVGQFIRNASAAGLEKIVIDLQRNSGGTPLLAYTIFKALFPDLTPFAGSRRRSFELANVLGSARTEWWQSLNESDALDNYNKVDAAANDWVITDKLNANTGRNFSSWTEYQGPVSDKDDTFSLTERYDLANPTFDTVSNVFMIRCSMY